MTPLHIALALWIRTMLNRVLCAGIAFYALGTKGAVRLEYKDSSSSFLLEAKDKPKLPGEMKPARKRDGAEARKNLHR